MKTNTQSQTGEGEYIVFRGNDGTTHSRKVGKIGNVTVKGAEIITRNRDCGIRARIRCKS